MRVLSRIALLAVLVVLSSPALYANHQEGNCPLSLSGSTPPATAFELSPAGAFRNGNLVHVLRGQVLTTYTVNDLGDLVLAREDFIGSLGARDTDAGIAFSGGHLFLSSQAGLEIYDLRNVRSGGNAPLLVSRTPNVHSTEIAVRGNTLAAVTPLFDIPCTPTSVSPCFNTVELYNITSLTAPSRIATISGNATLFQGFHDVAFVNNFLIATSETGVVSFNVANPGAPTFVGIAPTTGNAIITSPTGAVFGVVDEHTIDLVSVATTGVLDRFSILTAPLFLTIERGNRIRFNEDAYIDETNGRVITLIDEVDPQTLESARTIAIDVFDLTVPMQEGRAERVYENVTLLEDDERKFSPVAVGAQVFVVGEMTGVQSYASCDQMAGRIELQSVYHLPCSGAEIHGWVTGAQKIANVELFLDGGSLGPASVAGPVRTDVIARTPVQTWRVNVNLDNISRGEHILRAVGTDILGNRRQFSSLRLFFPGPGQNCTARRRTVRR